MTEIEGSGGRLSGELSRRGFIVRSAGGALALGGAFSALEALAEATPAMAAQLPAPTATAAQVRRTMEAFADTIVPGPAGGADRKPGAVEAGAVDEIYDPFYGVADVYPLLHTDLQLATPRLLGRPVEFDLKLPYADRERVVADRIAELPEGGENPTATAYQAVAVLVYLSYYGSAQGDTGLDVIGLPASSDGYFPGHSHYVRFRGMTRNGNPR